MPNSDYNKGMKVLSVRDIARKTDLSGRFIRAQLASGRLRGTRLAVEFIIDLFAQGWSERDVLQNYPGLTKEDIQACFAYASRTLKAERLYPLGRAA